MRTETQRHSFTTIFFVCSLCVMAWPQGSFGAHATGWAAESARISATCSEGFENVAQLASRGWIMHNNSDPTGSGGWYQGIPARFPAYAGPANSYVSADSNSASGSFPVISNWLISPPIKFVPNTSLWFFTRELLGAENAENQLQVRVCVDGGAFECTNVGTESGDVGGFQTLLISVNPGSVAGGYPAEWALYYADNAEGIPQSGSGRLAFRYRGINQNEGPVGTTIGIDSVELTAFGYPLPGCPLTDTVFGNGFEFPH